MMSSLKRLTIIRTMTRGNILGQKEIVARDKGEHSYYKWKGTAFCRAEETVMQWRSNKGSGIREI